MVLSRLLNWEVQGRESGDWELGVGDRKEEVGDEGIVGGEELG